MMEDVAPGAWLKDRDEVFYEPLALQAKRAVIDFCAHVTRRSFALLSEPEIGTGATEEDPLKWVADNLDELLKKYPDKWIMVKNNQVLSHSDNPSDLVEKAAREAIEDPFITRMAKSAAGSQIAFLAHGR